VPTSPLRNREWDTWLRTHERQEATRTPRGGFVRPSPLASPRSGGGTERQAGAASVVPAAATKQAIKGSPVVLPDPDMLPHACELCGLMPSSVPKTRVRHYDLVMCITTLCFAIYSELPKVWITAILISGSNEPESAIAAIVRVPIIAISGLYLLWTLLLVSKHFLTWCGRGRILQLKTVQPCMTRLAAEVASISEDAVTVQWQLPSVPDKGIEPNEFICTLYLLGDDLDRPMLIKRVPASEVHFEPGGRCCHFENLCPGTGYVVLVTAAQSGLVLGEPARLPCRTLPRTAPMIPDLVVRSVAATFVELTWEEPCELVLELRSDGGRRTELAYPPVQLQGLSPSTEYEIAVSVGGKQRPVPKLSFVTGTAEDEMSSSVMSSLTSVAKELAKIKESVGSIHAAAANAEVLRHLGTLQDRWASLQVSCLTEEIQKLLSANEQMKQDISTELKPVLLGLQDIHQTLASSSLIS